MAKQPRPALNTGYWAGGPPAGAAESIAEAERLGFDSDLDGKKDEAAAKIPTELIKKMSLLGPAEKIRDDLPPPCRSRS